MLLLNFFELSAIRLQHLPLVVEFAFVIVPLGLYVLQLFLHLYSILFFLCLVIELLLERFFLSRKSLHQEAQMAFKLLNFSI